MKLTSSTLRDLCYFALSEEQLPLLKEIELQPLPDWDHYYNLINKDFSVPREYFMLPITQGRDCCQRRRYVEVYSKFKLIPDSVHPVFGVYEPYAALEEAVLRNDVEMAKYYFSLLTPEQRPRIRNIYWKFKPILGKNFRFRMTALRTVWMSHFGSLEEFVSYTEDWQQYTEDVSLGLCSLDISLYKTEKQREKAIAYLVSQGNYDALIYLAENIRQTDPLSNMICVLESGREDFVDTYISSVNKKYQTHWPHVGEVVNHENPVISKTCKDIFRSVVFHEAAIRGGNPRIFLYVFHCSKLKLGALRHHANILQGMRERINPVGFYQLLQLVQGKKEAKKLFPDVDMNISYIEGHFTRSSLVRDTVVENLGYLPLIRHIKKKQTHRKQLPKKVDGLLYPLSAKILAFKG